MVLYGFVWISVFFLMKSVLFGRSGCRSVRDAPCQAQQLWAAFYALGMQLFCSEKQPDMTRPSPFSKLTSKSTKRKAVDPCAAFLSPQRSVLDPKRMIAVEKSIPTASASNPPICMTVAINPP